MRLGLFSVVDHYPTELGRSLGEFYAELLEQAEAAEEWGFDSFWVAEHHFHTAALPRPPVLLGAAAQRTRRIRLGSGWSCCPSTIRCGWPKTTRWWTCSRAAG